MATGTLSPVAIQQFFDNNGDPLAGGLLGSYLAGTDTPSPLYSTPVVGSAGIPLSNPVVLDAAGRAPELYLDATSYKLVLKNALGVTIWTADNVTSASLLLQQANVPTVTNITTGGTQSDLDVGDTRNRLVVCANTTDLIITGFAKGQDGDTITVISAGTAPVFLAPHNGNSITSNQLANIVRSGNTPLAPGYGIAQYMYFTALSRWKLHTHEQGHSIKLPFVGENFVATGGVGSWQVEAGDVFTCNYLLQGAEAIISLAIGPTLIGGAPTQLAILGWPFNFLGGLEQRATAQGYDPSLTTKEFAFLAAARPTFDTRGVFLLRIDFTTAWPALPTFHFYGQFTFEVE